MSRLLSADFSRVKKDIVLWLISAVVFITCILEAVDASHINSMLENAESKQGLNGILFEIFPFIAVITAMFISLFIGREYSFGTIRNKLISGHKRKNIYLSNYAAALIGSLAIYFLMLAGGFAAGIPLLGGWQGKISGLVIYILIGAFATAAMASVLTTLSMLSSNRAVTAVLAIMLALALLCFASVIYNGLAAPEMASQMEMTINGIEVSEPKPNPYYIGGIQRKIYEFLLQFLPSGQGILLANNEISKPVLNLVYSVVITVAFNIGGIFIFNKKDIK